MELEKFKATTELLNEARRNGITLTADQTTALEDAASKIAESRVTVKTQTAATDAITKAYDSATASAQNFARSVVDGLRDGQSFFSSFADTALNALDSIANKLLDSAFDGLFSGGGGGLGGLFSGGGGGLGGLISGFFAKGAQFDGARAFAKGGAFTNSIVDSATPFQFGGSFGGGNSQLGVMGEAGPEAIVPLERGPDGSLGIQAFGGGANTGGTRSNAPVNLTIVNNQTLTGAISSDDVRRMGEDQQKRTESNIRQRLPQLIEEQRVNGASV